MQIYDAHGTAQAVSELISKNPLANQLAGLWDSKHPGVSIMERCSRLKENWNKMCWLSRLLTVSDGVTPLTVVFGTPLVISMAFTSMVSAVALLCFLAFMCLVAIKTTRIIRELIKLYCELGEPLREINDALRKFLNSFEMFEPKNVKETQDIMSEVCFEIVRMEMIGLDEDLRFEHPLLSSRITSYLFPRTSLDEMRDYFRNLVTRSAKFGITTSNLGIHYGAAKEKWSQLAAIGEVPCDYAI